MMTMRLVAGREGAPGMNYDAWATARQPAVGIFKKPNHCDDYHLRMTIDGDDLYVTGGVCLFF